MRGSLLQIECANEPRHAVHKSDLEAEGLLKQSTDENEGDSVGTSSLSDIEEGGDDADGAPRRRARHGGGPGRVPGPADRAGDGGGGRS